MGGMTKPQRPRIPKLSTQSCFEVWGIGESFHLQLEKTSAMGRNPDWCVGSREDERAVHRAIVLVSRDLKYLR